MRRLFIQFYLLLIICFSVGALLVGLVYREVADTTGTRLLTDLLRTTLALIESELRTVPQPQWPQALAALDHDLGFQLRLTRLETLPIDAEAMHALRSGEIIMQEDETTYLQRLDRTPYVLIAGPMPYLVFLQQLHWVDIALLCLIGVLLALPVFLWMRPHWRELQQLERSARALADGQFDVRVALPPQSGLQPLAQGFNHMADSVQLLLDSKQTLLNAVAHELRTPLARLRYRLALRDGSNAAATDAGVERDLGDIGALIDELLLHAQLARPDLALQQQTFAAQPWLAARLHEAPALHQQSWGELVVGAEQLRGDPALLGRALDNLLNNATRYARQHIRLSFAVVDDWQYLSVADDGPGIPLQQRVRVLEPFVQLDSGAARSKGHLGLGLAIVSQIMQAHGGRVSIEDSPWQGAQVSLCWPLVQSVTHDNNCQQTSVSPES